MKFFYIIFISLSLNLLSSDLTNLFNTYIENSNISFTQSSINPYSNTIDKSEGRIIQNNNNKVIYIDAPFREKYELTNDKIIITDIELDQQSEILREDLPNSLIMDIFINGISKNNSYYEILSSEDKIIISPILETGYSDIEVKFKNKKIYYLKYNDNLNIENLIFLKLDI
jgi:hypothetical protein